MATSRHVGPPLPGLTPSLALTPHKSSCPTATPHTAGATPRGACHANWSPVSLSCSFLIGPAGSDSGLDFALLPAVLGKRQTLGMAVGTAAAALGTDAQCNLRRLTCARSLVRPWHQALASALALPFWGAPASAHKRGLSDTSNWLPRLLMGNQTCRPHVSKSLARTWGQSWE